MSPHPPTTSDAALSTGDTADARSMRHRLVRSIAAFDRPWGDGRPWDPRVLDAMRAVPRHLFMPEHGIASAYRDMPFPIGHGQTISQPTVVALMTQALALEGTEKVLEIGTGSGYQAAVASLLARELYTIELVEALGRRSQKLLSELGYTATPGANAAERAHHADGAVRLGRGNVHVRIGDGYAGWPEQAPFDRILLTAAPPQMPAALVAQLADGGVIVAPIGRGEQQLVRWVKRGNELDKKVLGAVRFVPMVPGK